MSIDIIFITLAVIFGFCMTWGVGANDLANVMGTSMGSRSLSVRQAIVIAIICEFSGALIAGGHVAATLRQGIINTNVLAPHLYLFIYGMLAVLLAGFSWMLLASRLGLPVSITHTIVGAIVGFGAVAINVHAVHWAMVATICSSWVVSPLLAGVAAYLLFKSIQLLIFAKKNPIKKAARYLPLYAFFMGLVFTDFLYDKIAAHFSYASPLLYKWGLALFIGAMMMFTTRKKAQQIATEIKITRQKQFEHTESLFKFLMLFSSCAMVFAHGSNDVANAVGPMAAIITSSTTHSVFQHSDVPAWLLFLGCSGVIIGFLMYGRRVIITVGSGITTLTPSRGFAATLAAACTSLIATNTGIPVSVTQILVGAVFGVGLARGIGALNLYVIRNIFMSWAITLPAGATFAVTYFYLFKSIFGLF